MDSLDLAPIFTLPDEQGVPVALGELTTSGPVVLLFYRGDWCSICARQLKEFAARLPDLQALGTTLVAISVDAADRSRVLKERLGLPFRILSDPQHAVIDRYAGLEPSMREGAPVGRPATYVIDPQGRIAWSYVGRDHRDRPFTDVVLEQVAQVAQGR